MATARRAIAALAVALLTWAVVTSPAIADVVEVNLKLVGQTDLGGAGPFDDVAVVGTTAVVATGGCPGGAVRVVDVKQPRRPAEVATLELPAGTAAIDVDATHVSSSAFTGDLVAVALGTCARGGTAVAYYDVTQPREPKLIGQLTGCATCAPDTAWVSLVQRDDGRILSMHPVVAGTLSVDDVSDPNRPSPVGRWTAPVPTFPGGCERGRLQRADFSDGRTAVVVFADGRLFQLDVTEPGRPADRGEGTPSDPADAGRSMYAAVLPVGARTLGIVSEGGAEGACPARQGPGLRILELKREAPAVEVEPIRFTTQAAPGRLVASGELVYVAWRADGLRVVDLGEVKAKAVGQFVPKGGDVVSVALLPDHILVSDRASGLYVLDRPREGGAHPSIWSDLAGFLPYLGFAGVAAVLFVVPRLAMGYGLGRSRMPSPAARRFNRR